MIKNLKNGDLYSNRKEAKMRLGGHLAFNLSMERGELLFIENGSSMENKLMKGLSHEKDWKEW